MQRITPPPVYNGVPCLLVATGCALGHPPDGLLADLHADGYAPLAVANKFIRNLLPVRRRRDFKRGERPTLNRLNFDGKAIVCVLGHYVYLDGDTYYSFFDNQEDDVVAMWELGTKESKKRK